MAKRSIFIRIYDRIWNYHYIKWTSKVLFFIFYPLKIDKKKIVIDAFDGRDFSDNPKYIIEELHMNRPEYQIYILLKDTNKEVPSYLKKVKYNSIKATYHLATAKLWIDNVRKYYYTKKKKGQIYIQTWHGGITLLKKVEADVINSLSKEYVKFAKKDSQNADLFISDSTYQTNLYHNSFWYNGEVITSGLPRNDIFFNDEKMQEIKENCYKYFNIKKDELVVLYAPTFRLEFNVEHFNIDYERLSKTLEMKFHKPVKILVKLHPNIAHMSKELKFSDNTIDASNYKDMQELLIFADYLISDYSSAMLDFILLGKPSFIFAVDIASYAKERGWYINLDELPFLIATNNDELNKNVLAFDNTLYQEEMHKFFNKYGVVRGNASKKIVAWILKKMEDTN